MQIGHAQRKLLALRKQIQDKKIFESDVFEELDCLQVIVNEIIDTPGNGIRK